MSSHEEIFDPVKEILIAPASITATTIYIPAPTDSYVYDITVTNLSTIAGPVHISIALESYKTSETTGLSVVKLHTSGMVLRGWMYDTTDLVNRKNLYSADIHQTDHVHHPLLKIIIYNNTGIDFRGLLTYKISKNRPMLKGGQYKDEWIHESLFQPVWAYSAKFYNHHAASAQNIFVQITPGVGNRIELNHLIVVMDDIATGLTLYVYIHDSGGNLMYSLQSASLDNTDDAFPLADVNPYRHKIAGTDVLGLEVSAMDAVDKGFTVRLRANLFGKPPTITTNGSGVDILVTTNYNKII